MGACASLPSDIPKEIRFENLFILSRKRILHSTINFQGIKTTFFELIGNNTEILNELTEEWIEKILNTNEVINIGQVCEINIKYPLAERKFFYEKFKPLNYYDFEEEKLSFKDVKDQTKSSKYFLLSDQANSGKSVTFKNFAIELKKQYKLHWVTYIDLHEQKNFLEKLDKKRFNNDFKILLHCAGIKSELETKIFLKLFSLGRLIFLFDGVDILTPDSAEILREIFEFLVHNDIKNQLWISTRPDMSSNFRDLIHEQNEFKFAPFTGEEKKVIIQKVLEANEIYNVDKQNEIINEIIIFMSNLRTDYYYERDIDSIFMIQTITEYRAKNSKPLDEDSFYAVFASMIEKQKTLLEIPSKEKDNDALLGIWDVHRAVALEKNFPTINLDLIPIVRKWRKDRSNWTSDIIQRYGFMHGNIVGNENSKIHFVHKSYADFFVAQFIVNFLFGENEELEIPEIKAIINLFIKIMCSYKNEQVCCSFIVSYFKTNGNEMKVCEKVKKVIFENLQKVYDPTSLAYPSDDLLKNFSIFMSLDSEMTRRFFKFDKQINLLDEFVLKGWLETNACTFIKAVTATFGQDWHLKFNKSKKQLMTHEEIEQLEGEYNDIEQIKMLEIYLNGEESEAQHRFLNDFHQIICYNGSIQIESISRMKETLTSDEFLNICLLKVCYNHITPESLNFIHESVTQLCSEYIINIVLFDNIYDCIPPLIQCLNIKNPEIFEITANYYLKHKCSRDQLQNFFLFRKLCYIFLPCNAPTYHVFKKFLMNVFETGRWQLRSKVNSHVCNGEKFNISLKCENAKDLLLWIFSNNAEVEGIYDKMFANSEQKNNPATIS